MPSCIKCGSKELRPATAEEVGGLPGIRYEQCNACGRTISITTVQPKKAKNAKKMKRDEPPTHGRIVKKSDPMS